MPNCGSQCILCDLPIRMDTYKGCTHACDYCFVKRKTDITQVELGDGIESIKSFISGKRTQETNWCDWDIPLHWGGMSDPFQPAEKHFKRSLEVLKIFAETKYPFVFSTKGKLCVEGEWYELLRQCNCVGQISMAASSYDIIEQGAPTFEERLVIVKKLSKIIKRVNIRVQPYYMDKHAEILGNVKRFAEAGAHGIILEGFKSPSVRKDGMIKNGGDFVYALKFLKPKFEAIRDEAHKYGLSFYAGENRLRYMGDDLCCCGIDELEGFKPNKYNANHFIFNSAPFESHITPAMNKPKSSVCLKAIIQAAGTHEGLKKVPFKKAINDLIHTEYTQRLYGLIDEPDRERDWWIQDTLNFDELL